MSTRKTDLAGRVKRLVESGLCTAGSTSEYVKELKQLVKSKVNDQPARRQSGIFKALSDPTRIRMVRLLNIREMCVCEIMTALDLTQATASHHLNILENAGLLKDKREGKWIFYALTNSEIPKLISKISSLSKI